MESDPIGLRGGSYSTYAYTNSNPLSSIDPQGLCDTDPCKALEAKIAKVRNELARRQSELQLNPLNLPPSGPFSIAGHQQQFMNKQTQLRDLLNDFNSQGCGGGDGGLPADAWAFATMPTPAPTPSQLSVSASSNQSALEAALTALLIALGAVAVSPQ